MSILLDRRKFLLGSAQAGLVIGLQWQFGLPATLAAASRAAKAKDHELAAWVRVGSDNEVTVLLSQSEIGQGISTTLPAILADELGADWGRLRVENAPIAAAYRNPRVGVMFTGNSESIQAYSEVMRQAGATARSMLIEAASAQWKVPASECYTESGSVVHRLSKRRLRFGDVAEAASRLPVPQTVSLKRPAELKLVGKALPRRDIPSKVDGTAVFGIDMVVPGMTYAAIRHTPNFGGTVQQVNQASVSAMPGVIAVVTLDNGVAVVAEKFWQAKTAVEALDVQFGDGPFSQMSSASISAHYRAALAGDDWGIVTNHGAPLATLRSGAPIVTYDYESQFLAHAPMEPMNCTASVTANGCEVWGPIQSPDIARNTAARALKMPVEKIKVTWTLSGGGFGRRVLADYVREAVLISQAVQRPVKLLWTREEDMMHDKYRPATLTRMTAATGKNGIPIALVARHVSATQLQAVIPEKLPPHVDPHCTEGLDETRYAIADVHAIQNTRLEFHMPEIGVPTSVLRTTGYGPAFFAMESFIDELAHAAGTDPYQYRRAMLLHDRRALAVLDMAAEKAAWGQPLPPGTGRGIAFCYAFNTIMAQVVELSLEKGKTIRLRRIVTVADPGVVFDSGIAKANLEGGAVWGLSAALKSEMHFENGHASETNFHAFEVAHLWETPVIDTYLIAGGGDSIGGIGEVGPVCIPPALCNALFAAGGERIRSLPVARAGYQTANPA
jgi:isoquinoline 1-oxidoreductase beta subunit